MSLTDLLNSSVWAEGVVVNEALLKHLQNLVEQIGEGKTGSARQEWFRLNSPHGGAWSRPSHGTSTGSLFTSEMRTCMW